MTSRSENHPMRSSPAVNKVHIFMRKSNNYTNIIIKVKIIVKAYTILENLKPVMFNVRTSWQLSMKTYLQLT